MSVTFRHQDVEEDFAGLDVRWVALVDRVVPCSVRVHFLVEGSFDPAVPPLLEALAAANEPLDLPALASAIGAVGPAGIRVVSEVLYGLALAGYARRVDIGATEPTFQSTDLTRCSNPAPDSESRTMEFLPGPAILRETLLSHGAEELLSAPFWSPPDWDAVYEPANVAAGIILACERHFGAGRGSGRLGRRADWLGQRIEALQRRRLRTIRPKYLGAELVDLPEDTRAYDRFVVHRCYVASRRGTRPDGRDLIVRRARGGIEPGYTEYLRALCRQNVEIFGQLLSASWRVQRPHVYGGGR